MFWTFHCCLSPAIYRTLVNLHMAEQFVHNVKGSKPAVLKEKSRGCSLVCIHMPLNRKEVR